MANFLSKGATAVVCICVAAGVKLGLGTADDMLVRGGKHAASQASESGSLRAELAHKVGEAAAMQQIESETKSALSEVEYPERSKPRKPTGKQVQTWVKKSAE